MNFKIDTGADPANPDAVRAKLEGARDKWIEMTPQAQHAERIADFDVAIAGSHNEARAMPVRLKNDFVRDMSKTLDEQHAKIVGQMNLAIAAAITVAENSPSSPVRITISGHVKTHAPDGIYKRLTIAVDDAVHG